MVGSELNDRLSGNAAADTLSGASGADRFGYVVTSDSTVGNSDRILDFSRAQGNKIDLAGVDANAQVDGNEAFRFIGKEAFVGAGQLRWFQQDGGTIVEANTTDATAGAELRIEIDPLVSLQAGDFLL